MLDETSPEFQALVADIEKHGLLEPIRTLDDMIIIGRNRYNACLTAGVEPWIEALPEGWNGDPLALVISSNRHRRQWTQAQLAWITLGLAETRHGDTGRFRADGSKLAQPIDSSQVGIFPTWRKPEMTQADAASRMSVNIDQVRTAAAVKKAALPQIRAAIENGKNKTINHAYIIVTPDKDEKRDGVTSEDKQRKWLADPRNIGKPRQPKPHGPAMPITDSALKALNDQQALVVVEKLTPKANRALKPKGKQLAILNLTEEGTK